MDFTAESQDSIDNKDDTATKNSSRSLGTVFNSFYQHFTPSNDVQQDNQQDSPGLYHKLTSSWSSKSSDTTITTLSSFQRKLSFAPSGFSPKSELKIIFKEVDEINKMIKANFGLLEPEPLVLLLFLKDKLFPEAQRCVKQPDSKSIILDNDTNGDVVPIAKNDNQLNVLKRFCCIAEVAYFPERLEENVELVANGPNELKTFEIVSQQLDSSLGKPAHILLLIKEKVNNEWKPVEVILSIRGTMSFQDVLTDAALDPVEFGDGYAHAGIARSANWIFSTYEEQLQAYQQQGVAVRIVGHSLGAGTAALTTMKLVDTGAFDGIQCFAFACPSLVDHLSAEKYDSCITCIIAQDDIVTRTCGYSLLELYDIVRIDYGNFLLDETINHQERISMDIDDILTNFFNISKEKHDAGLGKQFKQWFKQKLLSKTDEFRKSANVETKIKHAKDKDGTYFETDGHIVRPLHVPGKVIHLVNRSPNEAELEKNTKSCVASQVCRKQFKQIVVSKTMITDHFLESYQSLLLKVVGEEGSE